MMPHIFRCYLSVLTRCTPDDIQKSDALGLAVSDPKAPTGKRLPNAREALLGPNSQPEAFSIWWNIFKSLFFPAFNHTHKLFTLRMLTILYELNCDVKSQSFTLIYILNSVC